MSWNLWWRFGPDWRARQQGICATLDRLRPDVVGLQESWAHGGTTQPGELAERLGMHSAFAAPSLPPVPVPPEFPDQAGAELGVGLLSHWPVLRTQVDLLPAVHRHEPVALTATLDHPNGPLHVVVAGVEWEPEFADDQLAQVQALAALVADPALDGPLPVLLTADLNAAPDQPEIRVLTGVMADTWVVGGGDPDAVTLSSGHPFAPLAATRQIDRRIDYVLARPGHPGQQVGARHAWLAGEPVNGLYPSDHLAVVTDLVI